MFSQGPIDLEIPMADRTESIAPDYFSRIHIVLVEPKVPGNIGAVARAMTTMGLSRLVLINPVEFRQEAEARWMAHGAGEILDNAHVVTTLDEGVKDLALVVGTTNRTRGIWLNPIQPIDQACAELTAVARNQPAGILFGREDRGLLNDELQRCNAIARIPAATTYPSLNLAQSVMVCAYELFRAGGEAQPASEVSFAETVKWNALPTASTRRCSGSVSRPFRVRRPSCGPSAASSDGA